MYRFAVKNRFYHDKTVAYLLYDEIGRASCRERV